MPEPKSPPPQGPVNGGLAGGGTAVPAGVIPTGVVPTGLFARVIVPVPGNRGYTYAIPPHLRGQVVPGQAVNVPVGSRSVQGLVWQISDDTAGFNPKRIRPVGALVDLPALPPNLLKLLDWCSRYTLTAPGNLLGLVRPPRRVLLPVKQRPKYGLKDGLSAAPAGLNITAARKRFFDTVRALPPQERAPRSVTGWCRLTGVSETVIRGLIKAGQFEDVSASPSGITSGIPSGAVSNHPSPCRAEGLTPAQHGVFEQLAVNLGQGFSVALLDGVTGSGKTHVYTELIRRVLTSGKSVLVLLPEIALTSDILDRLSESLGIGARPWHSEVQAAAKAETWRLLQTNATVLVAGARSALWLPFRNLGLIIVDEEHDGSYKQSEGALYNARDMAIVRCKLENVPVILASATPAIETWYHAQQGKYKLARLTERVGDATMPDIELIDLCAERLPPGRWISPRIEQEIRKTLAAGQQAMLFLNKRGYAPLSLCRACGHRIECLTCTAWMTEHRLRGTLECHHCGMSLKKPEACPECKEEGSLSAVGPGVERLSEEVKRLFPAARTGIGSSDTLYSPARTAAFMATVKSGGFDILIGTQILAKGHNFRNLSTVAVIDADMGLRGGDPRAAEQSFQMLTQISGRAGRFGVQGKVMVQTSQPEDPLMIAISKHDRDGFIENEIVKRRFQNLPPFGRLASLILSDPDPQKVDAFARDLANRAPNPGDSYRILGPAPAPIAVIRGRHRRRFLVQSFKGATPQAFLKAWLANLKIPAGTRLTIDVDPYSFL